MTKKAKRTICIYIGLVLLLYIVVEILPKVTDIFETTMILEPGNLTLSYETTGYFIKEESVGIAGESGNIQYLVEEGTAVKKGYPIVAIDATGEDKDAKSRYSQYTKRLKDYEGLSNDVNAPISGVFSLYVDGYEDYFTFENMDKVKRDTVEGLVYNAVNTERSSVIKGEPMYKIAGDDNWYVLCWVDKATADSYSEGKEVSLQLPDGTVEADVYSIKKENSGYRVIFHLDVYYETFAQSRAEDMTVVVSDNSGLLIENQCIIKKKGEQGVYVKNKNGDYVFKRIKVIATDGKDSVIADAAFIDEEGNQVTTVDVYDEVLKHPENVSEKQE
ncbi:MAG: HlyD family efflux transporter periplasmic adaptor subunit [Bacillota bacterium]|nr:HlyD family efflux transporter periplasmic adaptor subunit [Bacillota bacterium]